LYSDGFENGRGDIDDVVELRANTALVLDPRRPGHDQAVARAAKVRGDLLGPLEWCVHRMRPTDGIVVERRWPTEFIHPAYDVFEVLGRGIEECHFIEQALRTAFRTRAVVALDVDDKRVVEFALVRNCIDDAAHLVVAIAQ